MDHAKAKDMRDHGGKSGYYFIYIGFKPYLNLTFNLENRSK
jgi:hypothetical protein